MRSKTSPQFRKLLARLPEAAQTEAREAYQRFKVDPYDPALHFTRLVSAGRDIYSARVGQRYRAVCSRYPDYWLWYWIGTHEQYNALLR